MAHPDILADPTATLVTALALVEDGQAHDAMDLILELHLHILAGGALPAQWRGEGTAVGALIEDEEQNIEVFVGLQSDARSTEEADAMAMNADQTMDRIKSVTGED